MGTVRPSCIWGRVYGERLRERFAVDVGASWTAMPSNAPRSIQARRTASISPRARASRIARNETSRSSVGICRDTVDEPRIEGLASVKGTLCAFDIRSFSPDNGPIVSISSPGGGVAEGQIRQVVPVGAKEFIIPNSQPRSGFFYPSHRTSTRSFNVFLTDDASRSKRPCCQPLPLHKPVGRTTCTPGRS